MSFAIRDHAAACAALHCCTTPAYASVSLNCSREDAAIALRNAVASGLFRRLLLPGMGNTPCYQPTAKASGIDARLAPKFLRSGLSEASCWRGLMRGGAAFVATPTLNWRTLTDQQTLCDQYAIPTHGHATPVLGTSSDNTLHVIVAVPPLLARKSSAVVIASAAARWVALLEDMPSQLRFATQTGRAADAIRAALHDLAPASQGDARRDLAALDARIAEDTTGASRIALAHQRAELFAAVSATSASALPWLARDVIEVQS
jgi:hypothetical protein